MPKTPEFAKQFIYDSNPNVVVVRVPNNVQDSDIGEAIQRISNATGDIPLSDRLLKDRIKAAGTLAVLTWKGGENADPSAAIACALLSQDPELSKRDRNKAHRHRRITRYIIDPYIPGTGDPGLDSKADVVTIHAALKVAVDGGATKIAARGTENDLELFEAVGFFGQEAPNEELWPDKPFLYTPLFGRTPGLALGSLQSSDPRTRISVPSEIRL